ncbi:hypothetical protein COHA_004172 [Chlorella ohadii]|uniref:Uncharacterized protein n=1 Tax=Chlorella ohadii TaxID=2649997 RepID=A0AAD5H2U6_9CHLO|nr:hypothetical protein COHA_004172 [Chlorella ohadii]
MPSISRRWNQVLCDRTCAIAAFAIAATAVGGALYRGDLEGGLLTRPAAALVLATVALLLLTFTRTYTNGTRRWAVAAYRVLACALLPPGSGKSADQLQHAAAGPALDAVRVLIGSRAMLLGMLSLGLPLDLPTHVAVQLLCLALMLPHMPCCCELPLLTDPTQRQRIAALHAAAAGGAGIFAPPDQLLGGPQAQCTAAFAFLLLFCGAVLPTLIVVRWTWLGLKAASQVVQQQQRQRTAWQQDGSTPSSSPDSLDSSPGGSSNELSVQPEGAGGVQAGISGGIGYYDAGFDEGQPSARAAPDCWLCEAAAAQRLPRWSVWILEQAFPPLPGLPAMLATMYVPLLAACCWLAGCLLALATAKVPDG